MPSAETLSDHLPGTDAFGNGHPVAAGVAGGLAAPVLLMWGLVRLPASTTSLLLNAEGVFTALLAWFVFRESFDRRIAIGMVAIVIGGKGPTSFDAGRAAQNMMLAAWNEGDPARRRRLAPRPDEFLRQRLADLPDRRGRGGIRRFVARACRRHVRQQPRAQQLAGAADEGAARPYRYGIAGLDPADCINIRDRSGAIWTHASSCPTTTASISPLR